MTKWLETLIERALGATEIYWTRALLLAALLSVIYLAIGAPYSPLGRHTEQLAQVEKAIVAIAGGSLADVRFQYVDCLRRARHDADRRDCRAIREGREPEGVGEAGGGSP